MMWLVLAADDDQYIGGTGFDIRFVALAVNVSLTTALACSGGDTAILIGIDRVLSAFSV